MLIANLHAFAQANGLGQSPFSDLVIPYRLTLNQKGFVSIAEDKGTRKVLMTPRSADVVANPLYDQPAYVLGRIPEEKAKNKNAKEYAEVRFKAFWESVPSLLREAGDQEALKAVEALLADPTWVQTALREFGDAKEGWIALALEGDDHVMIERPLVRAYLTERALRTLNEESEDAPHICVVTGERCEAVRLHDPIRGVPGTGGKAPLVSFNTKTAEQAGFTQGLNFPVSLKVMKGYTSALNHLLVKSSVFFSGSVCGVFWGPGSEALATILRPFHLAREYGAASEKQKPLIQERARREVAAAWDAVMRLETDEPLHMAFLRGSKGRIAIFGYDVRPAREVVESLKRFRDTFGSLSVGAQLHEKKHGVSLLNQIATIQALLLGKELPHGLCQDLLKALNLKAIVARHWIAMVQFTWLELFGALRHLERKRDGMEDLEEPQLDRMVMTYNEEPAYHFGRLVAFEASLKRQAHTRKLSDDSALHLLTLALGSPTIFLTAHLRNVDIYRAKLRRIMRHQQFVRLDLETMQHIQMDLKKLRPFTAAQRATLTQGYYHQAAYNYAYDSYRRALSKAKREVVETGTPEEAAAE